MKLRLSLLPLAQMYILQFFRDIIDRQTWSDEGSVSTRRLRSKVLSLACHLNDPSSLDEAHSRFKDWLQSNGALKSVHLSASLIFQNFC